MSWLGKVIGGAFGFLMGGPLGAILGTALGHQYDAGSKDSEPHGPRLEDGDLYRAQMAFFTTTFSVMGHLAKIDGKVSRAEIDAARTIMDRLELSDEMRRSAIKLFTQGKQRDFALHRALEQFHFECHRRRALVRLFIELLLETAYADGALQPSEEYLLLQVCDRIHVSRFDFYATKARIETERRLAHAGHRHSWRRPSPPPRHSPIEESYAVLGLRPSASDAEIKRAYRRLIGRFHPDRLAASGLPEEKLRRATEKTQQIRKAYEAIAEKRKL